MGVYIKNMEMPKSCAFCKIKRRNWKKMTCPLCNEEWDIHDPMSADYRLDNCPLVPVPPHGRLIDADELANSITGAIYHSDLRNAPTIIPAEEEDKDDTPICTKASLASRGIYKKAEEGET